MCILYFETIRRLNDRLMLFLFRLLAWCMKLTNQVLQEKDSEAQELNTHRLIKIDVTFYIAALECCILYFT